MTEEKSQTPHNQIMFMLGEIKATLESIRKLTEEHEKRLKLIEEYNANQVGKLTIFTSLITLVGSFILNYVLSHINFHQ